MGANRIGQIFFRSGQELYQTKMHSSALCICTNMDCKTKSGRFVTEQMSLMSWKQLQIHRYTDMQLLEYKGHLFRLKGGVYIKLAVLSIHHSVCVSTLLQWCLSFHYTAVRLIKALSSADVLKRGNCVAELKTADLSRSLLLLYTWWQKKRPAFTITF